MTTICDISSLTKLYLEGQTTLQRSFHCSHLFFPTFVGHVMYSISFSGGWTIVLSGSSLISPLQLSRYYKQNNHLQAGHRVERAYQSAKYSKSPEVPAGALVLRESSHIHRTQHRHWLRYHTSFTAQLIPSCSSSPPLATCAPETTTMCVHYLHRRCINRPLHYDRVMRSNTSRQQYSYLEVWLVLIIIDQFPIAYDFRKRS